MYKLSLSDRLLLMLSLLRLQVFALLVSPVVLTLTPTPASGQTPGSAESTAPDTGTALTSDMLLLDRELLARTVEPLERWGHTFYAFTLLVADTAGPPRIYEYGVESSPTVREPGTIADSLRSAIRLHLSYSREARTIGVIVDSIAGPFSEASDGVDGPQFPRMAVTELEDKSGRCRRVERDYQFVKDFKQDSRYGLGWGFGFIRYGLPRITRCEPRRYWPPDSVVETPTRPHLAKPIVRSLSISSLDNYFSVVGTFSGELTVFDDSVVVSFDTLIATRRLPGDQRQIRLDSIRVGVGKGDDQGWSPVDDSKAVRIGRMLPKGGVIARKNVRFLLRHERNESDDTAWIVVTFHITVGKRGEVGYTPSATTYAHSERGVLASDK